VHSITATTEEKYNLVSFFENGKKEGARRRFLLLLLGIDCV
jgi:hypothetical protein